MAWVFFLSLEGVWIPRRLLTLYYYTCRVAQTDGSAVFIARETMMRRSSMTGGSAGGCTGRFVTIPKLYRAESPAALAFIHKYCVCVCTIVERREKRRWRLADVSDPIWPSHFCTPATHLIGETGFRTWVCKNKLTSLTMFVIGNAKLGKLLTFFLKKAAT